MIFAFLVVLFSAVNIFEILFRQKMNPHFCISGSLSQNSISTVHIASLINMKFISLTILLAFATRSVLSEHSWVCTELMGGTMAPTTTYADMVMVRNQAPDSELRKGNTGAVKNAVKGAAKAASKGAVSKGSKQVKGMKKGNKKVKGAKKGGKKGNEGGVIVERKCAANQNNLSFTIFPDRQNPLAIDINGAAAGVALFFNGDFFGFQTQTLLILADGLIAQGQDSFVFFDTNNLNGDPVGSIAVLIGNGLPVIAGGTGIFLGADGEPVVSADNELGQLQLVFDICVSAQE
jgi:hypothetical protein